MYIDSLPYLFHHLEQLLDVLVRNTIIQYRGMGEIAVYAPLPLDLTEWNTFGHRVCLNRIVFGIILLNEWCYTVKTHFLSGLTFSTLVMMMTDSSSTAILSPKAGFFHE